MWAFGTHRIDGDVEWRVEHVAIQEEQGAELLILGRRSHLLIGDQVRQKGLEGCASQLARMSFVMEENITFNPGDRGFLRVNRVVREPDGLAHVVEKCFETVFQS